MELEKVLKSLVKQSTGKWSKITDTKYKTKINKSDVFLEKLETYFIPLSDDILSESYPPQKYQVTILNDKEVIGVIQEQGSILEKLYSKLLLK